MSTELKDCPFCGSKPTMKHIGNDHTKSRAVEVKCSNVECRVARTDKAFRNDHAWLTAVAVEGWNRRPALAASGGNAAPDYEFPPLPEDPAGTCEIITGHEMIRGMKLDVWGYVDAYSADQMRAYGKACAQSGPNAALVAALRTFVVAFEGRNPFHYSEYLHEDDVIAGRAALSAAGQEVGK